MSADEPSLDTRRKIHAAQSGGIAFLAYFDVLTVPLLRRLKAEGQPVTAIVLDPPHALLSAPARAELAASLSCVAAVVPCPGDPGPLLHALQPDKIIHWEQEDAARTANLIEHVRTLYQPK